MTSVAAVRVNGTPVLVGDIVITFEGERFGFYAGKIYSLGGGNVAIGWSGDTRLAREAIGRLRKRFAAHDAITFADLGQALDALGDLRGGPDLQMAGWIVANGEARLIRWASVDRFRFSSPTEQVIGDGGHELRDLLAPSAVRAGNTDGDSNTALTAISGFMQARFEEMLRPDEPPATWGAGFDMLALQGDRFRWLPDLVYIGWDVTLDDDDRIVTIVQAPAVLKQERVHDCLVLQVKQLGTSELMARVSMPVDKDIDAGPYERRPFSARARYYGNYFRIFRGGTFVDKIALVVAQATSAALVCHDGPDDQPSYRVNQPELQNVIREMLLRASRLRE